MKPRTSAAVAVALFLLMGWASMLAFPSEPKAPPLGPRFGRKKLRWIHLSPHRFSINPVRRAKLRRRGGIRRNCRGDLFGPPGPISFDQTINITNLGGLPAAAFTLSQNGGGSIYVQGPGIFHASSTIALAASGAISNVNIVFGAGAQVVIDSGVTFKSFISSSTYGGLQLWTVLFEMANCTQVNIYNAFCVSNNGDNSTIAFHVGGNASSVHFVDCVTNKFGRWAYHLTGYTSGITGLGTQDGPVTDVVAVRPVGDTLGFSTDSTHKDGGGFKMDNQSTVASSQFRHCGLIGAKFTNLKFTGFDMVMSSPGVASSSQAPVYFLNSGSQAITNEDVFCLDSYFQAATGVVFDLPLINLEGTNETHYQDSVMRVRISNVYADCNGSGLTGTGCFRLSTCYSDVVIDRVTIMRGIAGSYGFLIFNPTTAASPQSKGSQLARGYRITNCTVRRGCQYGMYFSLEGGVATSVLYDLLVDGMTFNDDGANLMTTGIRIGTSGSTSLQTRMLRHATFRKVDFTGLANASKALDLSSLKNDSITQMIFTDCPGLTPFTILNQGDFAGPMTNVDRNVLGPNAILGSAAAAPTTATTYTIVAKTGATVAATGATLTALAGADARGFPLLALNELAAGGNAANPTASTTYTAIGQDYLISASGGTGVSITATDFAGNTLVSAVATLASFVLPQGGTINFGAFSVAPSTLSITGATSGVMATPFLANTATVPTRLIPYGGTISATGTIGTWTVQMALGPTSAGFATVASPFGVTRLVGIVAAGVTVTVASAVYKAQGGALKIDLTTGAATVPWTVLDEWGNTIESPTVAATTRYVVLVPPGCYFKAPSTNPTINAVSVVG